MTCHDIMHPNFIDWTGQRVKSRDVLHRGPNLWGLTAWICRCRKCGHEKLILSRNLRKGTNLGCSVCPDSADSMRTSLKELRLEIDRRRKANHDERQKRRWNPEAISKLAQTELLDWIEQRLDQITTVPRPGRKRTAKVRIAEPEGESHAVSENPG